MNDIVKQVITEIIEREIQRLRDDDFDYCKLLQERKAADADVERILAGLNESDREIIEQYQDKNHLVWGIERINIYMRGFKDAHRFFKWMQM
jgi:hypothetical protein